MALLAKQGKPDPLHEQLRLCVVRGSNLLGALDLSSVVTYLALATCRTVARRSVCQCC